MVDIMADGNKNYKQMNRLEVPNLTSLIHSSMDDEMNRFQRMRRSNSIATGNIPKIQLFLAPQETCLETKNFDESHHNRSSVDHQQMTNQETKQNHLLDIQSKQQTDSNIKILVEKKSKDKDVRRNSLPDSVLRRSSIKVHLFNGSRRISQVSSAVTQQIQTTMGWKVYVNQEEIEDQARKLIAKFVWSRLRKNGFSHKRFHLQRLRSVGNMTDSEGEVNHSLNRVYFEIRALANQIELSHPKIFSSVLNNVGPTAFKSLHAVLKTQSLIGQSLFGGEVSWTHVSAMFLITSALCIDSVRSGHHDFVIPLVDAFGRLISKDLLPWISQEGGWVIGCLSCPSSFLVLTRILSFQT